ncbi:hypothetical protein [Rhizobium sp. BE258]|uniref:hypothetical protein n=1 Tax=Rhizobium sp. BE258 TaxID=2817722 RepID=UPI00285B2D2F|nr:hypothetical protein [Rhizobium sp. BE258]MDR7147708.1 hypothetical protein [Rhizobium sp. BE258]
MAVTDGESVWLVIITCEAIKATASPPEMSLRRLVRFAEYYRDLAAAAIRRGEDIDGKVWVTEATVLSRMKQTPRGSVAALSLQGSPTYSWWRPSGLMSPLIPKTMWAGSGAR